MNESIEKYKSSDENIHIDYEEKNYDEEVNFIIDKMKYIFKNEKANIYIERKKKEKEISDLKKRVIHLYTDKIILSKINFSNNNFAFLSRVDERMSLDTMGQDLGNSIHLWEFTTTNKNQIFKIYKNNDETFSIKNSTSNYFLGMEKKNEEWIIISRKKGENLQKFKFIYVENDYFLIQNENGKYIDLINNEGKNYGVIKPNDKNNSLGQQWKLVKI